MHPELNLDYKWMKIEVRNGFDNDIKNDAFIVYPGKIFEKGVVTKSWLSGPRGKSRAQRREKARRRREGQARAVRERPLADARRR